jgi:large subunit ribosomal protein L9
MDIILVRDVDKLGKRGLRVSVKPGFARNYLLPFNFAVLPTKDNVGRIEAQRKVWLAEDAKLSAAATQLAGLLKDVVLTIVEKSSDEGRLYGSVNDKIVAAKLAEQGFKLDVRAVRLDAPIREIGNFEVRLHLHADVDVKIPLRVRAEGFETWEPGQPLLKKATDSAKS